MKWHRLLVVGVVFLLVAGDAQDEVKKELARFEGTWKWVSIEMEKMKLSADALEHPRLKLMGDKFTVTEENNATFGGTFKVDPSKSVEQNPCPSGQVSTSNAVCESPTPIEPKVPISEPSLEQNRVVPGQQ